jgi:hypothetical protein
MQHYEDFVNGLNFAPIPDRTDCHTVSSPDENGAVPRCVLAHFDWDRPALTMEESAYEAVAADCATWPVKDVGCGKAGRGWNVKNAVINSTMTKRTMVNLSMDVDSFPQYRAHQ